MKVVLISIFYIFAFIDDAALELLTEQHPACTIGQAPEPEKLVVLKGWPYSLDCSMFFESDDYYLYDLYDSYEFDHDEDTLCEIRDDSGNLLLNASTSFDNLQYNSQDVDKIILSNPQPGDNLNFNLTVKIPSINKCRTMKIQLQLEGLQEESCAEFLSEQKLRPVKSSIGSRKIFTCSVPTGVYPKQISPRDTSGVEFKWMHNCGDLPEGVSLSADNSTLTIPSLTFEHGGSYSCAVSYKGMTRNLFSTSVCVQHGLTYAEPIMTCQSQNYFQTLGDDVKVRCVGNFGFGAISANTFNFRWKYQHENNTDVIHCRKQTALTEMMTSKSLCTYKLPEEACFTGPPPAANTSPKPALVEVVLTMRNLQPSDFGAYQSILTMNVIGSSPVYTDVRIIEEKQDPATPPPPHSGLTVVEIVGLSVGACTACFFIVVLIFAWHQFTDNSSKKLKNEKDEEIKEDIKV